MNKEEIFNEVSGCFKMSVDLNGMKKLEEYITNLQQENEKLNHYKLLYQKVKERNDLGIERLEALIIFWKKYNPIDNAMQVEQFKGVIELLEGNNEE